MFFYERSVSFVAAAVEDLNRACRERALLTSSYSRLRSVLSVPDRHQTLIDGRVNNHTVSSFHHVASSTKRATHAMVLEGIRLLHPSYSRCGLSAKS